MRFIPTEAAARLICSTKLKVSLFWERFGHGIRVKCQLMSQFENVEIFHAVHRVPSEDTSTYHEHALTIKP
jgi:hypothetical protein